MKCGDILVCDNGRKYKLEEHKESEFGHTFDLIDIETNEIVNYYLNYELEYSYKNGLSISTGNGCHVIILEVISQIDSSLTDKLKKESSQKNIHKNSEKNPGKSFEEDFKNSIPDNTLYIRLKDAGGWSNGSNTRFTPKNECDAILFREPYLYMLEFKSHKGKSLPLSCISSNQLKSLKNVMKYDYVIAGFVINFRDLDETYFIYADYVYQFTQESERKSISYDFVKDRGYKIEQIKKKVRYTYDVAKMLIDVI